MRLIILFSRMYVVLRVSENVNVEAILQASSDESNLREL